MEKKEIIEKNPYITDNITYTDLYKTIDVNLLLFLTVIMVIQKIYSFILNKLNEELEIENYRNEINLIDDQLDKMLFELDADKISFGKIVFNNGVELLRILLEKSKEYIKQFYKKDIKIPLNLIIDCKELNNDFIKKFTYDNCDFLKLYEVKSFIRVVNLEGRFIIGIFYINKDIEINEEIKKKIMNYSKKIELIINKKKKDDGFINNLNKNLLKLFK